MNTTIRDGAIVLAAVCGALLAKIADAPFDQETKDAIQWVLGGAVAGLAAVVGIYRNGAPQPPPVEPPASKLVLPGQE